MRNVLNKSYVISILVTSSARVQHNTQNEYTKSSSFS